MNRSPRSDSHPASPPVRRWVGRFAASLSTPGLLLATLFFAASLTPSLLPRTPLKQGILSGVSLAAGYGLGVFGRWLWGYLELPAFSERLERVFSFGSAVLLVGVALWFLRRAAEWQNSIRTIMGMEPVDTAHPIRVGILAALVAVALLGVSRLFGWTFRRIAAWLADHLPHRVANVLGVLAAVGLFWLAIDGVLVTWAMRSVDASFQEIDARMEPDVDEPDNPLRTGSDASLVAWNDLGRAGREFVSSGPRRAEIGTALGDEDASAATDPIRVYVGLNSAETIRERAQLALAELERMGAFRRSTLVIATPTGTGWVDPVGVETLEYLHRGDVATVAVQYSYLPSFLSLLAEPESGAESARAVFTEIYGRWTELPPDERPDLYLYGVSLGALNSERAADFYDVFADPFDGALWVGPPFRSETWRTITEERDPSSPAWLPRFRDGSVVRFTNQERPLERPGTDWGPLRIVYLQYASDPVTFFEQSALYRPPEWMEEPRGPDVSPELRWYPVVTMLQLAVDIVAADQVPRGYGHAYAPDDYLRSWIAVTDPPGWSREDVERLERHLEPAP